MGGRVLTDCDEINPDTVNAVIAHRLNSNFIRVQENQLSYLEWSTCCPLIVDFVHLSF